MEENKRGRKDDKKDKQIYQKDKTLFGNNNNGFIKNT
jgi:hypothetical protein